MNVLLVTKHAPREGVAHIEHEILAVEIGAEDLRGDGWKARVRSALGPQRAPRLVALNRLATPQQGCTFAAVLRPVQPLPVDGHRVRRP